MMDCGEFSGRAGKSKTVEWMAFRWAKCEEGRDGDGELGFLGGIGLECDVFCMRRSCKGKCEAFRSAKSFFLGLLGGGERWNWVGGIRIRAINLLCGRLKIFAGD
ncbi:hypothetical protein [Planomicrobium okeanokoites]|uniref:Uncharacterized protein n=1 Tax=Planomicrobium okeanokoites TaxID=244 RepID=A0ABV7KRL7_PLAOK|nr:hypothetical protein [Planomicrobium okeanokoites]TAA69959.1 hypothetical protein D2910_05710 [Planomicrobium okeanokoites]